MCRVLMYSGRSMLLDDVLYRPSSSLIRQTIDAKQLGMLNLGGFGLASWDPESNQPAEPFVYRTTDLPLFDPNLRSIATKLRTTSLLAHVRGIPYDSQANHGSHNLHPFRYGHYAWAMAHNGDLARFPELRPALARHLVPSVASQIAGNTDSEAMYALVMSQLRDPEDPDLDALVEALIKSLRILRKLREEAGIRTSSSANLFFTNGGDVVALRYVFDFGCYPTDTPRVPDTALRYLSLWYTLGEQFREVDGSWKMAGDPSSTRSLLVASEPLTVDLSGWVELPEYTILAARREPRAHRVRTIPVDV